jgi:mono/diheme cytochrome c family protein
MTTRAMVWSIVAAVALVGSVAGAGAARGPGAPGMNESAAGWGCPMMRSPVTPPADPGAPPAATGDVGSSAESPRQAQPLAGSAKRGQQVYLARCTACHSADPGRNGPVGPAVKGSAIDLVRARVLRAAYPPGYVPKRPTRIMPAQPDLAPWIVDLAAFLRTP